jgi:predicted amidohydrolase
VRIGLVEFDTAWQNPPENRRKFAEALPSGVDVAVYPELCFSGFTMTPAQDAEAEPFLSALAADQRTALVAGFVAPGPRNRAVAVDADGAILARYDKLHPFTFAGEHEHYEAGDEVVVFGLGGVPCALFVCYDLRFPEPFREAALNGAQLLIVIANWPAPRVQHWRSLLVARAIENQAFVVGVNRIGRDPEREYVSSSMAVGPDGAVLREGAGVVEIDPAEVARVRAGFPVLPDVRTDRYPYRRGSDS